MCFPSFEAPKIPQPIVEDESNKEAIGMEAERRRIAKRSGIGDTWLTRGSAVGSTNQPSPMGTRLKKNLGD